MHGCQIFSTSETGGYVETLTNLSKIMSISKPSYNPPASTAHNHLVPNTSKESKTS